MAAFEIGSGPFLHARDHLRGVRGTPQTLLLQEGARLSVRLALTTSRQRPVSVRSGPSLI